ncbi:MAG: UDP-N-acetylglucosamine 2-epimerase (non-hydrolyzing) [Burkholderiales bacterium]|nr:UDP-N-acetylglucosamine 2-epimerase (non-hydrolyzing) [Burkholderiales bacterium]MDE1925918.1 UDP-N-acetylglucosamine 2-epimerase (non-hydrolyzing) [Burkholderiales bacterium]MDE2157435.1 UDP-N-acetylglucosamine 2-epimerase (non-hydrolyzing) [Burkholderiales bacterium]
MKVMTVLGTRPEAIKLAPVLLALRSTTGIDSRLCVSGQHREMLDPMLAAFDLRPDDDLQLMRPGQSLAHTTQAVLDGVSALLRRDRPDWLLVQGDTTTAMAAALAGFYEHVAVGHVEAGLRTYDPQSPWPEEINRRLIAPMAALHFAPTRAAADNLLREGLPAADILVTGNTGIDALTLMAADPRGDVGLEALLDRQAPALRASARRLVLVTLHRRESLGAPLAGLCRALAALARRGDVEILFPVHLNPQVQAVVMPALVGLAQVHLLPPLDYPTFVALLKRAHLVVTDSGGLQEEGAALHVPVIVARDRTERQEAIDAGTAVLGGTDERGLLETCNGLLDDDARRARMAQAPNPFGDGRAAQRIVAALAGRTRA